MGTGVADRIFIGNQLERLRRKCEKISRLIFEE
jgi:hypothetical protein